MAAACVHIDSLRMSLTSLTHIKISAATAGQLTADIGNIEAQLTALKGQPLGAFSADANRLTALINKIKKDAAALNTHPGTATPALTADLTALKKDAGPMITEMKMVCHAA